jgi:hypothetical protein
VTQERLCGLATIALENDISNINYKDMLKDFISRNTRQMMLLEHEVCLYFNTHCDQK